MKSNFNRTGRKSLAGVLVLLTGLTCGSHFVKAQPAKIPLSRHKAIVIAHRGDHTEAPENTLQAYQNAIRNGADYVEIDLRTTRDGQLVIMHDGTINRMTNGTGTVREHSLAELRSLVVADRNHPEWPGSVIPTFAEVLQTCRKKIRIYLDFKDADVAQTLAELKKYRMEKSLIVYINAPQQFKDWRALAPQIPLMLSLPDSIKTPQALTGFLNEYGPDILDGDHSDYTAEMVATANAKGVQVWPDIQSASEGPQDWGPALEKGFTGLQTDHPRLLVQYLQQKGRR